MRRRRADTYRVGAVDVYCLFQRGPSPLGCRHSVQAGQRRALQLIAMHAADAGKQRSLGVFRHISCGGSYLIDIHASIMMLPHSRPTTAHRNEATERWSWAGIAGDMASHSVRDRTSTTRGLAAQ